MLGNGARANPRLLPVVRSIMRAGSLSGHGEFVGSLLPAQRSCLGFPPPGHPCWRDPSALALAIGRYPGLDPAPYVEVSTVNCILLICFIQCLCKLCMRSMITVPNQTWPNKVK